MEIRNLNTFLQVVESKSFTKAAEVLGYTQSTVSFQISQLEDELDCQLFDRIGHNIFLTSRGELLLEYAIRINTTMQSLQEDFKQDENPKGEIHIYVEDSLCEKMVDHYDDFHKTYPDIKLIYSTGSTSDMINALDQNVADVIFILDKRIHQYNYETIKESEVKLHFVTSSSSPLAKKEKITIGDILACPLILTKSRISYRKVLDEYLASISLEVNPIFETNRTDVIRKILSMGVGVSFLPDFTVKESVEKGDLVILNVDGMDFKIWKQLIYRKDKWISKALYSCLNFTIKHEFNW